MLHRTYRLPASVRFRRSQTIATPFFGVKILSNGLPVSRFGFLVSKKVDKRAVVRNRVKRQIRSGVESVLPDIRPGFDVLFIIHQAAINQETSVLQKEVTKVLLRNGLVTTENAL